MLDSEDMAGRPIPPEVYRPWMCPSVLLALHDRGNITTSHINVQYCGIWWSLR